jgi:spermidine/putrescine transport system substrate-binding protein
MSDRPVDPTIQQLVQARLSRRSVLFGAAGAGVAAALAGCGTGPSSSGGGTSATPQKQSAPLDRSDTEKVVNWAKWTL